MNAKPGRKPDDAEQSRRFLELAQEREAEGDEKALARAVKKLAGEPREKPAKKGPKK